jgi:hypothetical protein
MLNAGFLCAFLSILVLCAGGCATESTPDDDMVDDGDGAGDGDGDGDGDGGDGGDTDCVPEVIEMPTEAACQSATQTCIDDCEDDACYDSCLEADTDPDGCAFCIDDAYVACGNDMGCQDGWDELICCFDSCADPESAECETSCATEIQTYETCLESLDEPCGEATSVCFQ